MFYVLNFGACNYFIVHQIKNMRTHSIELKSSRIISTVKKIFFLVVIFATAFLQKTFAQLAPVHREDSSMPQSQLLHSYYGIKNALVAGNASAASSNAKDFIKALNSVDDKIVNETTRTALLRDAGEVSESKDIKHQREHFGTFSTNMYSLAKASKLTAEPVYYNYCPMKKAYWLSSEKAIKNPYFGNAMLTCGKVTETLSP